MSSYGQVIHSETQKLEALNSKLETNPKFKTQMFETFEPSCLFRISIFGFRAYSSLTAVKSTIITASPVSSMREVSSSALNVPFPLSVCSMAVYVSQVVSASGIAIETIDEAPAESNCEFAKIGPGFDPVER